MELLDFCYDILIRILEELDPVDLAACARTSFAFNHFIKGNKRLYKAQYLKDFDDPRAKFPDREPSWELSLQRIVTCQKLLAAECDSNVKQESIPFVASIVDELLSTATQVNGVSKNESMLVRYFEQPRNRDAFMYRSSLYARAGTEAQKAAKTADERQLSAKMHCLHGMGSGALGRRSLSTYPYARSRVYDLRNYTQNTKWGPFRADGSEKVDWEMVESIMVDLGYNSSICCPRFLPYFQPTWSQPFYGVVTDRMRAHAAPKIPMEPEIPLDSRDPYNVSGLWHRIVCFLDYNDLHSFNFGPNTPPDDEPRGPLKADEATRHIVMRLQVTDILPPGPNDNQDLPVVRFAGASKSLDVSWDPNANSMIRGEVRLTAEGDVRWTTISVFLGGEERWRSEGIQVGGPNSKRGVVGTWFDKDYDPNGPAGPTAYWKTADKHELDWDSEESYGDDSDEDE